MLCDVMFTVPPVENMQVPAFGDLLNDKNDYTLREPQKPKRVRPSNQGAAPAVKRGAGVIPLPTVTQQVFTTDPPGFCSNFSKFLRNIFQALQHP